MRETIAATSFAFAQVMEVLVKHYNLPKGEAYALAIKAFNNALNKYQKQQEKVL